MTQIMTPSKESKTTTDGQIIKAVSNYRALLEKHAYEFNSEAVQTALGQPGLADEMFALLRKYVEAVSNLVARFVKVNRTRSPQEMLDATGRKQYTDGNVVKSMPHGTGDGAEVVFFKPEPEEYTRPGYMSDDDLEKALARRELTAADPYSLTAVNEADPAFADKYPNGTHWKDANGNWCFAAFRLWGVERGVHVDRLGNEWIGHWWCAGLRK